MNILVTSIIDLKKSQNNRPHQLIKHLSLKHSITVLSINDWWKSDQTDTLSYGNDFSEIFDKIDYHYLTEKRVSPILQELMMNKQIDSVDITNFDVHFNYNTLISGYRTSKKIATLYDIADDLGAMIRHSPQIPKIFRPIGELIGNYYINKNINISKKVTITTRSLLDSYKIPANKVQILPNGVDLGTFKNVGENKAELGLSGFIVGYVGVLREWVDFKPIFRALLKLPREIKLIIVGQEGFYHENIALAKEYGVLDRVIFTGVVPYSQVPKYISAMDVCLIPFKMNDISRGALPLKLFEYMACEKPVISTDISGVRDAVGDRVIYVKNEFDYEIQILNLFYDDTLRKGMGSTARKFVEDNYSWKKISSDLDLLLREVPTP